MSIHDDLVEAYKGTYDVPTQKDDWILDRIKTDTPEQRLKTYLEWNGIVGYTGSIWYISQGRF